MKFKRIGMDTSKSVFTIHGIDADDRCVLGRDLRRCDVEKFFAGHEPTVVAVEACGGSHHWGRVLRTLGHEVRLIPPQYVKPFVKRGKNDRNDAAAICEAAGRPDMTYVPVKTAEQQAEAMVVSARALLVGQRTQLINAVRGHAAEFGLVTARGTARVEPLLERLAQDASVPASAKETLALLGAQVRQLGDQIAVLEPRMQAMHKANAISQLLAGVPGIGPITALTLTLTVDPRRFESGRHLAAWIGLTPTQRSTGGRTRLGGISKAGNERLRQLLVLRATAVIRHAKPGGKNASAWLLNLLEHKARKLAAVALANKMARIVWAMMTSGEAYRGPAVTVAAAG